MIKPGDRVKQWIMGKQYYGIVVAILQTQPDLHGKTIPLYDVRWDGAEDRVSKAHMFVEKVND